MFVSLDQERGRTILLTLPFAVVLGVVASSRSVAGPTPPFRYEEVASLDDMKALIRREDPVGTSRDMVRGTFVWQGRGTLKLHPTRPGVEKYLYDINLCRYYVWRWNVSADYDRAGRLAQMYVNGDPALPNGSQPPPLPKPVLGGTGRILKIGKPRPEADKGETMLIALVYEFAGGERRLLGVGPSRADPADLGRMHGYNTDPWRSIFDADAADRIVPYAGDCAAADAAQARAKTQALPSPRPTGTSQ